MLVKRNISIALLASLPVEIHHFRLIAGINFAVVLLILGMYLLLSIVWMIILKPLFVIYMSPALPTLAMRYS